MLQMFERCVWFLLACLSSVEAVALRGVSARALWQQAWSSVLEQNGIGSQVDSMPSELKQHLEQEAKQLWKSWLQTQQQQQQETEVATSTTTASTYAAAVYRLTEGLDKISEDDVAETIITTTSEDPTKVKAREDALEAQRQAQAKLMTGLKDITDDDVQAADPVGEATTTTTTSTTNPALKVLLAGIDGNPQDGISFMEATTTTTSSTSTTTTTASVTSTTADPKVIERRKQEQLRLMQMRKQEASKLTEGFAEIDQEEATATTTTTTEASTTTTTTNPDLKVLLQGMDGVPVLASPESESTTTTTTTTSTTFIPDAAALKTVAFITSGTYQMPKQVDAGSAEADDESDDSKKKDVDEDMPLDSDAAADFDMDNAGI